MQGRVVGLRVFLEGIEIDVASVAVHGGMGQPASATVEIPYADTVHRLLPRTLIHVFFCESRRTLVDPTTNRPNLAAGSGDPMNRKNWVLLFAGEVMSYRYTNAGGSRQAVLDCSDFSSYWGAAKLYWGSNSTALHTYKTAIASGATQVYAGKKQVNNTNALLNLLMARPSTNAQLTGVLGGLVALLEASTGVFHPNAKKRFRGVNDFLSQAELRLHLTHMIGAAPDDTTSAKFLDANQFKAYVRRLASSMGSTASFADLLNLVMGRIYYGWSAIPAPPYFPENPDKKVRTKILESRKAGAIADPDIRTDERIISNFYKKVVQPTYLNAQKRYGDGKAPGDPSVKVEATGDPLRYLEFRAGSPTSATWNSSGHQAFQAGSAGFPNESYWLKRVEAIQGKLAGNAAGRERFNDRVAKGYAWAADAAKLLHTRMNRPTGVPARFYEQTTATFQQLRQLLEMAAEAMGGGLGGTMVEKDADISVGDRLNAHLFTPDLYMAPPPTCNVLFPDHYHSIRFGRDWMSETTRLLLHTKTTSGQDVKNIYFAPSTDILSGPDSMDVLEAVKKGVSFLMPHEKFTGPIVDLDGIGDTTIFRNIHKEVVKENKKNNPTAAGEEVSGEALYSPQEHLRRAANYLFFAKRLSGRSMVVQARFCPQVVVGLPMLVLDPKMDGSSRIGNPDASPPKGTHYLGLVIAVDHQVDAQGNATSTIHLTKCREHREGIDMFDPTNKDRDTAYAGKVKKVERPASSRKMVGFQEFSTDAADTAFRRTDGSYRTDADRPVFVEDKTVVTSTSRYDASGKLVSGAGYQVKYKSYKPGVDDEILPVAVDTQMTVNSAAAAASPSLYAPGTSDVPTQSGSGLQGTYDREGKLIRSRVVHQPVEVYKSVRQSPILKPITFNFEETATPPWFADIFLPFNIGKRFYEPMLGCGSVLDSGPLATASNPGTEPIQLALPDGGTVEVPGGLTLGSTSTLDAADKLGETWKGLVENQADVSQYIDLYVTRAYATLPDILGDRNPFLYWRARGALPQVPEADKQLGFHGNAYGEMEGLQDVDGAPLQYEQLADISGEKEIREVSGSVDPRRERWDRVLEYVRELEDHH